ncbi:MAG: binding-protein-dependent transport system inner rane component [Glaciihabitans sp.]|nr:binding-protein-dependent transport system inner rane component [Glaciihabitans sp.]
MSIKETKAAPPRVPRLAAASSAAGTPAGTSRGLAFRATPYLLIAFPITLVIISLGYPLFKQLIMSFQEFGLAQQFGRPAEWVGLDNYVEIVTDPYFWQVLLRSLVFCFAVAGLTMVIGVGFAVLMQRVWPASKMMLQLALVLAWAMPSIAALAVWQLLIDSRYGLVNWLLTSLGLSNFENFNWLHHSSFSFYVVAGSVIVWASVPLVTLTTFAALNQIDPEVVEAAQLDGAGLVSLLRRIVLPLVAPVLALLGILQIIWDLRVFTQIHVLQISGGDATATNLLGTYVYSTGIAGGDYGMASALAMVMLLILLVITWRYVRTLSRQGDLA